ncbi:PAC2 domain containing protein [Marine Group I thaumarchaeote SCGC AAA799-E16]|uniref:PAC2 domain containing protein n=6 Tax=Marine Group I TaxID=905826 RepID=A0A087S9C8_9ARCH|nr:PAC2 domain containing protein [Marine Group I thaumarchaeote SCGC AAA799-E16]KFM16441.1 PAC2 domain containing protein [Marine Group I thaumarchaeote SCGC AAA799-D11]KFM18407.1 PAC2 domain containing protein [Marine Group I thaumarchaeote SCGC RSA3]KFM22332.1 PAC2 domain containing protein [Marine Group I thaumarchaeote SCGC AAA799-B03]
MYPKIRIKEFKPLNLEGGYLIDGFPSAGFSSAIATESMVHTSKFELAGVIDSDTFPPISVIKDGKPNFPSRVFVNEELKVGVFLSYLTLDQSLHKVTAKTMLKWAQKHKIGLVVSSIAVKSPNTDEDLIGIGSTDSARKKIRDAGLKVLEHGTVPGIPGTLLNEASITGQDVIVIIFHTNGQGPDFKSSAQLCVAMSKLIPGTSCDIPVLQKEAEKAETVIKEAEEESRHLKDSMYM